jgi:hypothetical protein
MKKKYTDNVKTPKQYLEEKNAKKQKKKKR